MALETLRNRWPRVEPESGRHGAGISVWIRWLALVGWLAAANYRVEYGTTGHILATVLAILPIAFNAYVHYRVRTSRSVTAQWLIALSAMDLTLVSLAIGLTGGISSSHYVFLYPALATFAAAFASLSIGLAGATLVAGVYCAVTIPVGPGLVERGEQTLLTRIFIMYSTVGIAYIISRFERLRARTDLERQIENGIKQRVGISQTLHDTTAQSAFMVSLGIATAMELADKSNEALMTNLKATYDLSKSAMWELRHPIDSGLILEGRELSRVLKSHASSFTTITSIPSEVVLNGSEPPLPETTKSLLFSVAHNAMTNAFRHSGATKVIVCLSFEPQKVRVSISDDGAGLPDDYAERGHGFRNMKMDSERAGGSLEVQSGGRAEGGTTISCVVPSGSQSGG